MASGSDFPASFYGEPGVLGLLANGISAFLVLLQNFHGARTGIPAEGDENILAGGFGVAKNLSNWATTGKDYLITPEIEKVINGFHKAKKPMGMCCISPVLAAKAIPGCEITVGHDCECEKWPYAQVAVTMAELGSKHLNKNVGEVHVDPKNKLVTTSAFMCNAP